MKTEDDNIITQIVANIITNILDFYFYKYYNKSGVCKLLVDKYLLLITTFELATVIF